MSTGDLKCTHGVSLGVHCYQCDVYNDATPLESAHDCLPNSSGWICPICNSVGPCGCISIGDPPPYKETPWYPNVPSTTITFSPTTEELMLEKLQEIANTNKEILEELRGQSEPQGNNDQYLDFKYWQDEADSIIASHDPAVDFTEHLANCLEDLYYDIKDGVLPKNKK